MKLKIFWSTIIGAFCLASGALQAKDKYANFGELSRFEREGKDYSVEVIDRKAPVAVLAIHGGKIEPGTESLARAIARNDLSFYIFESKKNAPHDHMHVTAHHFDDPRALALVEHSRWCVSIHGFLEFRKSKICVGGANAELRDHIAEALRKNYPFEIEPLCPKLKGLEPQNIVNRCQAQGVQLELSVPVLNRVLSSPKFKSQFANNIRRAIFAEQ